jgi:hypothetical protein
VPPPREVNLEPVRRAMQQLVAGPATLRTARLKLGLETARDLRALWHLRGALMQALAAEGGEARARRQIAGIDPLFTDGWPEAPVSRPAPLI